MPKADPSKLQKLKNFFKKKKPAAKKLGQKAVKQQVAKAAAKAKWEAKQAPAPEKKAYAEVEDAVVAMCVEEGLEEVEKAMSDGKEEKAKKEAQARIKRRVAEVQKAKKRAKKAAAQLPEKAAKEVEKELNSSFESAMKFWKDLEAEAKKEGLSG
ncbi:MAG: hypothetical protein AAF408_18385 [Pseudomonadota bacterium]